MGFLVERSGGVFLLLDLVGFLIQEERNLVTEGPPPRCATRKPFFGYTSGFYTAEQLNMCPRDEKASCRRGSNPPHPNVWSLGVCGDPKGIWEDRCTRFCWPGKGHDLSQHRSGPDKGVITKGVFSLEKPLESLKTLEFSRVSRKWPESPLFSTVWGFSNISRISKFSRISTKWIFLKRPLFQKTPFPEPEQTKRSFKAWNIVGLRKSLFLENSEESLKRGCRGPRPKRVDRAHANGVVL